MTNISKLIAWARCYMGIGAPTGLGVHNVALGILANLDRAPSLPCGHTVEAARDAEGSFIRIDGDTMDLESAHGFALAILRAVDEQRAADAVELEKASTP